MSTIQFTKLEQIYPFLNTIDDNICWYITNDLKNRTNLKELNIDDKIDQNTNYFIKFTKPSFTLGDIISESFRYEHYDKIITKILRPFFPNISLVCVKRSDDDNKWCRINLHSILGINLPAVSGIHSSVTYPIIKVGKERFLIIPAQIITSYRNLN